MKTRIWHLAKPLEGSGRFEAEEICLDLELPLLPVPGMLLRLAGTPELVCVERAFWDAAEPQLVHVFTRDPARLPAMGEMSAQGWRCARSVMNEPQPLR